MIFYDFHTLDSGDLAIMLFLIMISILIIRTAREIWELARNYVMDNEVEEPNPISRTRIMEINVPFVFQLGDLSGDNSKLHCLISSQINYKLVTFWGVSINEFHLTLSQSWINIRSAIEDEIYLDGFYQHKGMEIRKTNHDEEVIALSIPSDNYFLGTPPRSSYPLIIFFFRDSEDELEPQDSVALIIVLHLKDQVCSLPTSILAQYLKQASGRLLRLKPLFLPYDDTAANDFDFDDDEDEEERPQQLCIVCQNFPLSRALLPCRHTCICATCFNKLSTCPLCRAPIRSYFCITTEDMLPELENTPVIRRTFFQRVFAVLAAFVDEWGAP